MSFLIGLILFLRKKKKAAYTLLIFSFIWLLLITTTFLPDLLIKSLENQNKPISEAKLKAIDGEVNILVLGNQFVYDKRLTPNNQLSEVALSRLVEGIRIMRQLKNSKLITSGYGNYEEISVAEILAQTALQLGLDSSRLELQKKPENTGQEATEYKRLFGKSKTLILVTSATHMPRALYLFRKAGLNPIAAPCNYLLKTSEHPDPTYWVPSAINIRKMEAAVHEYVGLLWVQLGGE